VKALTITELETATSTPRSTIYFYVREGLLPAAQKAAASRALYSDVHVELLGEIRRLKHGGADLEAIKTCITPLLERQSASEPDLVARRAAETRAAILQAAARRFARNGYKRTRVADIIREVGITAPVFYTQFATKRQLFLEAFNVFVQWMSALVEPPLAEEPDLAVHLVMRVYAYWGLQRLSPDLLGLARAEAFQEGAETRAAVQEALRIITTGPARDFAALRCGPDHPPVPDELMAYGMFGAAEAIFMRASWDEAYSPRDLMLTHLFTYLAIEAAYTGRTDIDQRLADHAPLIDRLIESGPPVPPTDQAL
jgi:AcrR family transcriptional regulator